MRTKEVEKAIESLNINKTMVLKGGDSCIASVDNIETVLAYIEELEKDVKDAIDGYQDLGKEVYFNFISKDKIREKIKELEEKRDKFIEENKFGSFMEAESGLRALKSIIEEE